MMKSVVICAVVAALCQAITIVAEQCQAEDCEEEFSGHEMVLLQLAADVQNKSTKPVADVKNKSDVQNKSTKPVAVYLDAAERGFAPRVALFNALGKDGWEDVRMDFPGFQAEQEKWRKGESSKLTSVLGYLPELRVEGRTVTQASAIARSYAMQGAAPLYPGSSDPLKSMRIDEVIGIAEEILNLGPGATAERALREAYAAGPFKRNLDGLAKLLGSQTFFVDDKLTLADLYVFTVVDLILVGFPNGDTFELAPPEYVDQFPTLRSHCEAVRSSALVAEYLKNYKN